MSRLFRLLAVPIIFLALTGCMGSVGTTTADGRSVKGESGCFSYAVLKTTDQGLTIDLGGKTVQVTTAQITWSDGGTLQLPATWNKLELSESFNSINVYIDGKRIASIHPAKEGNAIVITT
jgi:hypothetical protein